MTSSVPADPKIYHIVHVDRLSSIVSDGGLWCDARITQRRVVGTTIGMNEIKKRRLGNLLFSHPDLHVGDCVSFYFCPRSIMLYVIHQANHPNLLYRGGQGPIVHLEADLRRTVSWAGEHGRRWAFTLSNAGAFYFDDRRDLAQLSEIDWPAVHANRWSGSGIDPSVKEHKQAEFLLERHFPWELVSRVGVLSQQVAQRARAALDAGEHRPPVEIRREWYY